MKHAESNSIIIDVEAKDVYKIICESINWPEIFEPCIAVKIINRYENAEHIEVTAYVNGLEMTWESHRIFLKEIFGINSKISKPMKLVKSMDTFWRVIQINAEQCLLVLEHIFEICDEISNLVNGVDTQENALKFIKQAIYTNSTKELRNIKESAELFQKKQSVELKWSTFHTISCLAPASEVYKIIKDVNFWPQIFESCISARVIKKNENIELVRIEAIQNDATIAWETKRIYFHDIFRIDFELPTPMPFLKSMNGQWRVIPIEKNLCLINVVRNFELLENVTGIRANINTLEEASDFIKKFIAQNADNEMQSIKSFVEKPDPAFIRFKSKYIVPFKRDEVFQIFSNVAKWPEILPHCNQVEIIYDDTDNQEFIMHIKTNQINEQFRSIRKCNKETFNISYFQPVPPPILRAHSGNWQFNKVKEGTEVVSEHSIYVDPVVCAEIFQEENLDKNKQRVREIIQNNSKNTVEACKNWLFKAAEVI